ncbi:hypothetical protein PE067_13910 [Paracoccus sp. DMF-8]|uniref:hypothetical protein n=1 Tax=Paracoccus sp. DMF-8 TaxID=3019445 RepID=UPI0023E8260E|nr:hypothetical protein [Paracoccus sp. DMF-8]MDF3607132.1 hypothetical protein [Paracoccus sp. DMF-8]
MLLTQTHTVAAGPWARETGKTFLSLSVEQDREDDRYTSLYAEYGLSPRHTVGLELGHADQDETSALLWFQRVLDNGQGPDRVSVASGIGAIRRDGQTVPVGQISAHWGRGFDRFAGGGWMTVDTRIKVAGEMRTEWQAPGVSVSYLTPETSAKADLTLGLKPRAAIMLITQLRLEQRKDSGFSAKLAGSVVQDIAGPAKVELGVIAPVSGDGEPALKIGSWLEF